MKVAPVAKMDKAHYKDEFEPIAFLTVRPGDIPGVCRGQGTPAKRPERPRSTVDRAESGFPALGSFISPCRWSERR
jgi:hypothetical protein